MRHSVGAGFYLNNFFLKPWGFGAFYNWNGLFSHFGPQGLREELCSEVGFWRRAYFGSRRCNA